MRVCVRMCVSVYVSLCESMRVCVLVRLSVFVSVCVFVRYLSVCASVCVCMCACVLVCACVCVRVLPGGLKLHTEGPSYLCSVCPCFRLLFQTQLYLSSFFPVFQYFSEYGVLFSLRLFL